MVPQAKTREAQADKARVDYFKNRLGENTRENNFMKLSS
jgi:hypothetical protein